MRTKQQNIELIKKLSDANGISGFEDEVVEICKEEIKNSCDYKEDTLRNLHFSAKGNTGNKPKIWLDAHSDEIGFIVQHMKSNGTIHFIPIGSWANSNIPASKVRVRNNRGEYIPGVVAAKPVHFQNSTEKAQAPTIDQMAIDVGACSLAELKDKFGISVAAPIVPDVTCSYDEQYDLFLGKAFDCRAGCAALIETLEQCQDKNLQIDVVGAFSAQEEVGLRGVTSVGQALEADISIVFEGCPADDTFAGPEESQTALRKGPMLRHLDCLMITNPRFMRFALDIAKQFDIPVQEAVRGGGGTSGGAIHMGKNGIPTIVIGIPVRYAHSHHGFMAYEDYENAVKLAVKIIENIDGDVIAGF